MRIVSFLKNMELFLVIGFFSFYFSFGAIFFSNSYVRTPDTARIPAAAMKPTIFISSYYIVFFISYAAQVSAF